MFRSFTLFLAMEINGRNVLMPIFRPMCTILLVFMWFYHLQNTRETLLMKKASLPASAKLTNLGTPGFHHFWNIL